jgi:alpha-L-rhamnosidase
LKKGENCVGAVLGVGWYKGTFCHWKNGYGDTMQLICEIRIWFEDKTELIIGSDSDWKCHVSAIIASGIYYGEDYDSQVEVKDWSMVGASEADWKPVILTDRRKSDLIERINPPLRIHDRLRVFSVVNNDISEVILDFGQEITGWVEFNPQKVKGTVVLSYGEILQNNHFYRGNLRLARAVHRVVADGRPQLVRPHFTFFGFRFVRVEGIPDLKK